jgi:hypothetical protein
MSPLTVAVLEQEPSLAYHTSGRSVATFLESYGPARAPAMALLAAWHVVGGPAPEALAAAGVDATYLDPGRAVSL